MDAPALSYAASIPQPFTRALGRAVERVADQRRLERLYREYRASPDEPTDFWDEAIRRMNIDVALSGVGIGGIPREGPLLVVTNHPFGALDGIALAWAIGRVRDDVKVLAHEALVRVPETRPHLFVIDFSSTRAAERANVLSRAGALAHLKRGGTVVVFPAGAVMTTPNAFSRHARELEWGPLTARLALRSKAQILPIFLSGQNGRLFQIASNLPDERLSQTLRYALLFRETARFIGGRIELQVGELLDPSKQSVDPVALTEELRHRVLQMSCAT